MTDPTAEDPADVPSLLEQLVAARAALEALASLARDVGQRLAAARDRVQLIELLLAQGSGTAHAGAAGTPRANGPAADVAARVDL